MAKFCDYEKIAIGVKQHAEANGVVLLIFRKGQDAEMIAALDREINDQIASMMAQVAVSVNEHFEGVEHGPTKGQLRKALEESVKLQAHYAALLNMHDGGERRVFATAEAWLDRLKETKTLV